MHHQMTGLRYNYSQPFFVHFDVLFGTRISTEKFQKMKKLAEDKAAAEKQEKLDKTNDGVANGEVAEELKGKDASPAEIVDKTRNLFVTTARRSMLPRLGRRLEPRTSNSLCCTSHILGSPHLVPLHKRFPSAVHSFTSVYPHLYRETRFAL